MQDDAEKVQEMISTKDQEELLTLVAEYLERNITCVAIGGTAMMFQNYKTTTKDIDLIFQHEEDRNIFIRAIQQLGYQERALGDVYNEQRKEHRGNPLMYSRGDERFDLFVNDVFGYEIDFDQEKITQRNDFLGKKELTVYILPVEELLLLKAITGRERDYEDIETILHLEKNIDWTAIVQHAIRQKKNNEWILIDLEETLQRLKTRQYIKQELFEMIYEAQKKESDTKLTTKKRALSKNTPA